MRILYDADFDKTLDKLPSDIQEHYRKQEAIFRQNWRDPRLHIKKLINHPYPFSFRVTRAYRVLFVLLDHTTAFFAVIASRKDAYR